MNTVVNEIEIWFINSVFNVYKMEFVYIGYKNHYKQTPFRTHIKCREGWIHAFLKNICAKWTQSHIKFEIGLPILLSTSCHFMPPYKFIFTDKRWVARHFCPSIKLNQSFKYFDLKLIRHSSISQNCF